MSKAPFFYLVFLVGVKKNIEKIENNSTLIEIDLKTFESVIPKISIIGTKKLSTGIGITLVR